MGKFKTVDINELIDSCTNDVEDLTNEITAYDQNNIAAPTSPEITNMVNQQHGTTVDFSRVYGQLERLIENGNQTLETLNAFDLDVASPDIINAATSLMNSIKNCMTEFTKIHLQHIKFQQSIQMEEIKFKHKQEIIEKRLAVKNGIIDGNVVSPTQMIEVKDNDIINFIKMQESLTKKND